MKQQFILFLLSLWFATPSYSQDYVKCTSIALTIYEKDGKKIKPLVWDSTEVIIVLNSASSKLKIYSKEEQEFDLIKETSSIKTEEKTISTWQMVDKIGEEGEIMIIYHPNFLKKDIIVVKKKDITYAYKVDCTFNTKGK